MTDDFYTPGELITIADIAQRLDVKIGTVYQWGRRRPSSGFPIPSEIKAQTPLWRWHVIEKWASETGRLGW